MLVSRSFNRVFTSSNISRIRSTRFLSVRMSLNPFFNVSPPYNAPRLNTRSSPSLLQFPHIVHLHSIPQRVPLCHLEIEVRPNMKDGSSNFHPTGGHKLLNRPCVFTHLVPHFQAGECDTTIPWHQ